MKHLRIILFTGLGLLFIGSLSTPSIRRAAEKQMLNEERITAARNQQIMSGIKAMEKLEEERQRARLGY